MENENFTPETDVSENTPVTEAAQKDKKQLSKKKFPQKETSAPRGTKATALTAGTQATVKNTKNAIFNVLAIIVIVLIVACVITLAVLTSMQKDTGIGTTSELTATGDDGSSITATFVDAEGNAVSVPETLKIKIASEPVVEAAQAQSEDSTVSKLYFNKQISASEEIVAVYDITLNDGDAAIQPGDASKGAFITLKLAIPESLKDKDFKIVHIHGDNDVITYTKDGDNKYVVSEDGSSVSITTDK